jgi:hypothetical protein
MVFVDNSESKHQVKNVTFQSVFDLLCCYLSARNVEFEQIADVAVG